jgi:Na+/melibiose symporter-like transporter
MTWVYTIPTWMVCVALIGGCGSLSAIGLMFARLRLIGPPRSKTNDFAGPILATLGTILAVMLSFMVVTVWQEYDQSAQIVQTEADQISDLYHEVSVFPQPFRNDVHRAIQRYVDVVVREEWPMMRDGKNSLQAHRAAAEVEAKIESFDPKSFAQQNAQADALHHTHAFMDARSDRLFQNRQSVPLLLWAMMFFVAAVTLGTSYFFYVPDVREHLAMTIALGAVIGAIFVVIAELDLPFRGDLQIPPSAFAHDYSTFGDDPPHARSGNSAQDVNRARENQRDGDERNQ